MAPSPPTAQQRANFDYVSIASLAIVSWEILVHLFQDYKYLRLKAWYKRPIAWAYFLQRYCAFLVLMAEVNIRVGKPKNCYAFGMVALVFGGVVVLPSVSLIYLYRVLAIWGKRPAIKYGLIAAWVVLFGASMTAPFSQTAANLPSGGCTIIRSEGYASASFIANAVYDTVIFVLTAVRLIQNRHEYKNFRSPVQTTLLRDGILYFAVSVIIGIVDIVFLLAVKSPVVSSTVIPIHIALTSVMTTRLVNNVFHVVRNGNEPQFLSTDRISAPPAPSTALGNMSGTSASRTQISGEKSPKLKPKKSDDTVIFIGSGVGTNYFSESGGARSRYTLPTFAVPPGFSKASDDGFGDNTEMQQYSRAHQGKV